MTSLVEKIDKAMFGVEVAMTPEEEHEALASLDLSELRAAALDAERVDWLSRQYVAVRIPLRYGSRECFVGSPDEDEDSWDIRAVIDARKEKDRG